MPVAIIGLFNSGSSILAEIVSSLGWNLGPPYWGNHFESQSLRRELVRWWNEPELIETVGQQERVKYLKQWLSDAILQGTPVGAKHPLLCLSAVDLPLAWGPDVQYIRAYRDLNDSIAKLDQRGWFKTAVDPYPAKRMQMKLWKASQEFFARHEHLHCDYNELLADPRRQIMRIADFLNTPVTEQLLETTARLVKRPN